MTGRRKIRYVDIGSVDSNAYALRSVPIIDSANTPSRARQVLKSGDTVFSTVRPYLEKIAYIDSNLDGEFASTGFCVLRPGSEILPRYLFYYSISRQMLKQVLVHQRGVSYPAVLEKNVKAAVIPVPPLYEQRRIVNILEDHLSRLDAGRSAIGRSQVRHGRLRQTTLARVISSAALAEGSEVRSMGDIAVVGTGATPLKARRDYYDGGSIPWVTSADLAQGLIEKPTQFVTPKALAETNVKLFPAGTLLVAMYGEGKTRGTVGELASEATTNQACAAIKLHNPDPLHRAWVRLVLEANYWNMRRLASGGVQPNLNLSLVRQIQVPLPPIAVRDVLLRTRDTQEQARRQLESELCRAAQRAQSLRRALLHAAFSGQLTGRTSDTDLVEEMAGV
jgi:type I restriction enzyme S subunit